MKMASKLTFLAAAAVLSATAVRAQGNNGAQAPEASVPFVMSRVASFNRPWRIAFLPDGRMLITERVGPVWLVTQDGQKTPVANVPAVLAQGQGGMLGVFLSPHYASDHQVYLTYSAPEEGGSGLALARARLALGEGTASLEGLKVIWRDGSGGNGGHFGAAVAFSPDGRFLFLTLGDRQRFDPAQDPNSPLGKILRLILDGRPAPGNPWAGKTGTSTLPITDPPRDTEAAKTAPVVRTFTFPGPNLTPSMVFYKGAMFPQWDGNGSVLIGGLSSQSLSRIVVTGGTARAAERWNVGRRIRDVAVGPDGAVWMLEDANPGGLFRVTPK